MRSKRQKTQLELAFPAVVAGEARDDRWGGTEFRAAKPATESPAVMGPSMEDVLDRENLTKALRMVRRNKGAPGIDGMTVDDLPAYLREQWPAIRDRLLQGAYAPQPVRRVMIPKVSGGERPLGIPTALDRLIQQAVLQVLQRQWDPTFSEHSFGFRPGRSAHQAVARAQEYVAAGHGWVVDLDLEKFFDRVNHDRLMAQVAKRVADKRLLKLIRGFLTAGAMEGGVASPVLAKAGMQGTPQGGPLSPLLSNLVLDELDRELEKRGHRFVRYADDCNIYVRSERAGQRVMASVTRFVEGKLKLKVNAAKSAVAQPWQRQFLGFSLTADAPPKRTIAPKARARFQRKVRGLSRRTRGKSLKQMIDDLAPYLVGWRGYFGFCETPSLLVRLDQWTRRRLRAVVWHQWKRGRTRYRNLRRRGVNHGLAARTAGSAHGPWRLSGSKALHLALPNAFFASLGLPSLQRSHAA
jgi:RNA-directed DNA polymerase